MNSNNTKQPLLSIIVPVYNTETLLKRCIESVTDQTYTHWELLLVDDGSTDSSLVVCQEYAQKDKRIKVFHQSNQGQSVARNLALEHANGDFIAFLDSDDAVTPPTYENAISSLKKNTNCNLVVIPIKSINTEQTKTQSLNSTILRGEVAQKALVNSHFTSVVWNKIYQRDVIQGVRFKPGILFEDNLFIFQVAKKVSGICCSEIGYYEYHQEEYHPDKNRWDEKKDFSTISVYIGILELYQEKNDFDQYVRMKTYLKFVNYLYPRIMKREISPKLSEALHCLSNIKLSEVWDSKTKISLQQRIKLSLTKVRAYLYCR